MRFQIVERQIQKLRVLSAYFQAFFINTQKFRYFDTQQFFARAVTSSHYLRAFICMTESESEKLFKRKKGSS